MTAGELRDKLGEVPADTPVEFEICEERGITYGKQVDSAEYDEERGWVVLS